MRSFLYLATILPIFSVISAQPNAPSNFVATPVSDTQINLSWNDNSNNELYFEIERQVDNSGNWPDLVNKAANATQHTDSGLSPGTYEYRIRASNNDGVSDWVYSSSVTLPLTPVCPTNFVATPVSDTQINLSWNDNSNNELYFEIERQVDNSGNWPDLVNKAANATQHTDSNLSPGIYEYRIRASNNSGSCDWVYSSSVTLPIIIYTTPVAEWWFNEGSGNIVTDHSLDNNITLSGSYTRTADEVCFDGSSAWGTVPDNSSFIFNDALTIIARVKLNSTSGYQTIIRHHKQTGDNEGWLLRIVGGKISGEVKINGSNYSVSGTINLNTGILYELSMIWSNNSLKLFVNGVADGDIATSNTGINSTSDITIGRLSATNGIEYLNGCLDNLIILDYDYFNTVEHDLSIPENFNLSQNYPNPFNPITTIWYDLPEQSYVTITIYDLLGRQVKTLVYQTQEAGYKSITWDTTNMLGQSVSAGMYFYQIKADDFVQTRKMILLK